VALSLARRRQLLAWAAQRDAWIIEDDYDSEFRYHGKPLPPLKSLDAPQRVIYAGAFSKSLFPALRAAWLVVPEPLVAQFREQAALMCCSVPTLWQQTLADFIREGHFWRHLKKMRASYASADCGLSRRCGRRDSPSCLRRAGFRWWSGLPETIGLWRSAPDGPVWPYRR
jgi:GntR family transcriptional regulator/MocR family aminotransferase